jgi:hypothetical protein
MIRAKREQYRDIFVFSFDHPLHHIVFDPREHKYYHKKSDIFLGDEDIAAYKLRDPVTIPRDVTISQVITLYFTEESCKSSSHIQTSNSQSDASIQTD